MKIITILFVALLLIANIQAFRVNTQTGTESSKPIINFTLKS